MRIISSPTLCVITFLACVPDAALAQTKAVGSTEGDDLPTILAVIKSRAANFASFDAEWRGTQKATHQFISGKSAEQLKQIGIAVDKYVDFPVEGRFVRDNKGRIRIEYLNSCLAKSSVLVKTKKSIEIYDGKKSTQFFSEGQLDYPFASITNDRPDLITRKSVLLPLRIILCPFADEYGVLPSDPSAFTLAVEIVNNVACARLATKDHVVWLSMRDQYLPVRHHYVNDGRILIGFEYTLDRAKPAGFPIRSWKQTTFDAKGKVESEIDAVITRFTPEPSFADNQFQIVFPSGTWVSDQTRNEKYLVKPDGSQRPIRAGEFTGTNYQELLTTDPPRPPSRLRFVLGLTAGILVLVGSVYYLYRRNHRSGKAP